MKKPDIEPDIEWRPGRLAALRALDRASGFGRRPAVYVVSLSGIQRKGPWLAPDMQSTPALQDAKRCTLQGAADLGINARRSGFAPEAEAFRLEDETTKEEP